MNKRSRAGSECVSAYELKNGTRQYRIVYRIIDPLTGISKQTSKRGFATEKAAVAALHEVQAAKRAGTFVKPDRRTLEAFATEWLAGHSIRPSTAASYCKNLRLHVFPGLGKVRLQQITTTQIDALYRGLERDGRTDGRGGLSPTTVRYIHVILRKVLARAVEDSLLAINPADRAHPPTLKSAKAAAPERQTWTAEQVGRFLRSQRDDRLYALWVLYATTGMRRGEALALRWSDLDLADGEGRATVARTVGKVNGKLHVGPPKGGRIRVVDLDPATVVALQTHKRQQAAERLRLGGMWADEGLVFAHDMKMVGAGGKAGGFLNPDHVARLFKSKVATYNFGVAPDYRLPSISVHEIRHTWATMAMLNGISPKIVQERLGHSTVSITLGLYSHVSPSMQAEAARSVASAFLL